ncbi:unnamed protein product [Zymoseptoria tritici ST99CH_3D1]|nr:unnamed protein product [Zymoseptoria tritici ST99CH_3D1]
MTPSEPEGTADDDAHTALSNWIAEWTPSALVCTYLIALTAMLVLCNERTIKILYFFYISTNSACMIDSFLGLAPVRTAREAAITVHERAQFPSDRNGKVKDLPIIDIVIVAYLPNEKDIIRQQILHACKKLLYPKDKLNINLVYNTPIPIEPLETELARLPQQYKTLRVIKAPSSTSKADNLNYFFTLKSNADIIGIFDTDHCPHPHNPRWAAECFLADDTIDIVQGRCIVYNTSESFYAKMISIEFDRIYAISHPGRRQMFGLGLFCGSNGYWRAPLLRKHKMDGSMLTEDIDSALRAYGLGKQIVHDMNVVSFETAPNTFAAFWKQRLRWAQGWCQASIKHMPLLWTNPPNGNRGFNERLGLFSLLFVREISYHLIAQHVCLLVSFLITDWPSDLSELVRILFFRYPTAGWFFWATFVAVLLTLYFTEQVRSRYTTTWQMAIFSLLHVPYLVLVAVIGLYGHARQLVKYDKWNPTARK